MSNNPKTRQHSGAKQPKKPRGARKAAKKAQRSASRATRGSAAVAGIAATAVTAAPVVPLRKEGLLRPQEDEPFAGFGFDLDEGAMIIRNPDGTIERESLIDDD